MYQRVRDITLFPLLAIPQIPEKCQANNHNIYPEDLVLTHVGPRFVASISEPVLVRLVNLVGHVLLVSPILSFSYNLSSPVGFPELLREEPNEDFQFRPTIFIISSCGSLNLLLSAAGGFFSGND